MLKTLSRQFRRILHPYHHPDILPGRPLSPLDAIGERAGVRTVEAVFAANSLPLAIAQAFARYLGEDEGARAIKKEYHVVFDKRLHAVALRLDPAERHNLDPLPLGEAGHPLDLSALHVFSDHWNIAPWKSVFVCSLTNKVHHWLALIAWAVTFLGHSLAILVRQGTGSIEPLRAKVATPDFWASSFWCAFRSAAEENGEWSDNAMLMVRERGDRGLEDVPFPSVNPAQFRVPRTEWLKMVIIPGLRLVAQVLVLAIKGRYDPKTVEISIHALRLANSSLKSWRVAFNVRARWYLDIMHYSADHCVRASIFRRFGMGLVAWPFHQFDSPGSTVSYVSHDLFIAGGNSQPRNYGGSWNPHTKSLALGQLRNDRRVAYTNHMDNQVADEIARRLAEGQRMAVLFPDNDDPGWHAAGKTLYRAAIPLLANRPGWFLVIKQKKPPRHDGVWEQTLADPNIGPLLSADNIMNIHRAYGVEDTCPAAWLIERMILGISLSGTVQWESLARGKPHLAYFPVNQDTPAVNGLKADGLLCETFEAFRDRVEAALADPAAVTLPLQRVRDDFDVYADDNALSRIATALLGPDQPGAKAP